MKTAISACILLLAGCAGPMQPVATTDSVLAAQYRARTPHGAMTGAEAGVIADSYAKNIAAPPAQVPQTSGQSMNGGQQ